MHFLSLNPKIGIPSPTEDLTYDDPDYLNKRKKHLMKTICYYHVMYAFQSESTLYSCLNVKELLAQNRCDIWSLSDSNGIQTHNHLVPKQTLNHLAKLASLAKCLSVGLWIKWLWVQILLLSDEEFLQIWKKD